MRVLCVAAHPDDEVLGCGATLAKHAMAGDDVRIVIFGSGRHPYRPGSSLNAAKALGTCSGNVWTYQDHEAHVDDQRFDEAPLIQIITVVESAIHDFGHDPCVIYTHYSRDRNKDHRIVADAVLTAARPVPGCPVKRILQWETPSSTEWGEGFAPNVWVDVSGEPFARKLKALECYKDEMRPSPHPRSVDAIEALAEWRGSNVGVQTAEAFMLVRSVE